MVEYEPGFVGETGPEDPTYEKRPTGDKEAKGETGETKPSTGLGVGENAPSPGLGVGENNAPSLDSGLKDCPQVP